MPVELLVVAQGGQVLAQDHTPNLRQNQVVRRLLETMGRKDTKASYAYDGSVYHCLVENEVLYIAATDANSTTLMAYTMLNDVKEQFRAQFGAGGGHVKAAEVNPSRCAPFGSKLGAISRTYTSNPNHNNKMGKLKGEIEGVKEQMLHNLDELVQRGGNIENLCEKTEMLTESAGVFENEARRLKRKMLLRNIKIAIAIALVVILLSIVIAMFACGVTFSKCKSNDNNNNGGNNGGGTVAPTAAP